MHEKFSLSEKELNTWKDREKSIVDCLAATESLSRVLHIARDQLLELGADVSVVDDVLHNAASLSGSSAVATLKESNSTTDDGQTCFGDQHPPVGSLLARGSAADLRIIQDNILQPYGQDLPPVAQSNGLESGRTLKRKRLDTTDKVPISYQHNGDTNGRQQRLSSRDAMPPPVQLLQDTSWTKHSRHDDYSEVAEGDNYNRSNSQCPIFNGAKPVTEDRSYSIFAPTAFNFRERHTHDGVTPQTTFFFMLQALQRHGSSHGLQHPSKKVSARVKVDIDQALNSCRMDRAPTVTLAVIGNRTAINTHLSIASPSRASRILSM
ncbi:MAG: hypothetical protein Q9208_003000 [Pyrenodesmia sp. 3 TL-2023]